MCRRLDVKLRILTFPQRIDGERARVNVLLHADPAAC